MGSEVRKPGGLEALITIAATVLTLVLAIVWSLHKASSQEAERTGGFTSLCPLQHWSQGQLHSELPSRLLLLVSVPTVCVCVWGYWCKL